jgi:hypothetical protein
MPDWQRAGGSISGELTDRAKRLQPGDSIRVPPTGSGWESISAIGVGVRQRGIGALIGDTFPGFHNLHCYSIVSTRKIR